LERFCQSITRGEWGQKGKEVDQRIILSSVPRKEP